MSLDELHRHQIPFVVIDHRGELGADVPSVGATNWRGGKTATTYLLSLNHQRIGVLSGPATIQCNVERIAGYRAALEAANVPFDPDLVRPGDYTLSMGYEQTCALLDLPDPPTAIFAGCDLQAMGVYSALRTRGISIPHEMSVIGFDDVQLASLVTPTLTTVRQPLVEMGQVATTMLLRQIAGEPLDTMRAELTTSLIIREFLRYTRMKQPGCGANAARCSSLIPLICLKGNCCFYRSAPPPTGKLGATAQAIQHAEHRIDISPVADSPVFTDDFSPCLLHKHNNR